MYLMTHKEISNDIKQATAKFCKAQDTVLFKTKPFDSLKNRFNTFNAADHNVLLSLFILI